MYITILYTFTRKNSAYKNCLWGGVLGCFLDKNKYINVYQSVCGLLQEICFSNLSKICFLKLKILVP